MPTGFEDYEGFTKRARKWIRWLIIEFYAHHPIKFPITAKQIGIETTRHDRHPSGMVKYDKDGEAIVLKGLAGTEVRAIVHFLRQNRYPIASGSKGYSVAQNEAELKSTIQHLKERRKAIDSDIEGLENADFNINPTTEPGEQVGMFNNYGVAPGWDKGQGLLHEH